MLQADDVVNELLSSVWRLRQNNGLYEQGTDLDDAGARSASAIYDRANETFLPNVSDVRAGLRPADALHAHAGAIAQRHRVSADPKRPSPAQQGAHTAALSDTGTR